MNSKYGDSGGDGYKEGRVMGDGGGLGIEEEELLLFFK